LNSAAKSANFSAIVASAWIADAFVTNQAIIAERPGRALAISSLDRLAGSLGTIGVDAGLAL
jgi:hypothetical protein